METSATAESSTKISSHKASYKLALRQLRMWPLQPNAKAVDNFFRNTLLISEGDGHRILYEQIKKVVSPPRARQHSEILETFKDLGMKDLVLLFVRNLSTYIDKEANSTPGMCLKIPGFLSRI